MLGDKAKDIRDGDRGRVGLSPFECDVLGIKQKRESECGDLSLAGVGTWDLTVFLCVSTPPFLSLLRSLSGPV